jgi:lysophospholipase L1-like esterase
MIQEFIAFIVAIFVAPPGLPADSAPHDQPTPNIVLVGDSITDMNRSILTDAADACDAEIALHSQSSRRIADSYELDGRWINSGLDEIDRIRATQDPTTWIIELGTNDLPNITTVADARHRIDAVLDRLDDDDRVIWTTVLFPIFSEATQLFNDALTNTAGIELVAWDAVAADHLADAVHPSERGARLLGELYCDALDADPLA